MAIIVEPKKIDLQGIRHAVYLCGNGAPTVVLEPGLGATAYHYQLIQKELAKHTTVFAYDARDRGTVNPVLLNAPRSD